MRITTVQDVFYVLRAALPNTVPVLLPEQLSEPAEYIGQPPEDGQPFLAPSEGLGAYLREQAPYGYVQLYDLTAGVSFSGWADQQPLTVHATAPTDALALALAGDVRALIGVNPREGGNVQVFLAPFISHRHDGIAVTVTTQYTLKTAFTR